MNCGPGNHNNNNNHDDDFGNEAHAGHFAKNPFENWFVYCRVVNIDPRGVGGLSIVAIQLRRSSLPYIYTCSTSEIPPGQYVLCLPTSGALMIMTYMSYALQEHPPQVVSG